MAYVEIPRTDIDTLLRYAKEEFKYLVYKKANESPDGSPENDFWTLELTQEDAKVRIQNETQAYGDIPSFQFGCCLIERTTLPIGWIDKAKKIPLKRRVCFNLTDIEFSQQVVV